MANLNFSHGGNIYEAERKYNKKIIDFSANINPLGLPPNIKKAIYKNFGKILHYPDPETKDITGSIASYWGIKEENILVGNGSTELIYLIMSRYRPKITAFSVPTFSEYERAAKNVKSRIRYIKMDPCFRRDDNEKAALQYSLRDSAHGDILFLCNPNNPTGSLIIENRKMIEKLFYKLIVVDEAFMDFLPDEKKHTLIRRAQKSKKIIVLRTLTKFFALPGLRIGYLVAHRDVVRALRGHQAPWSANAFAQLAGNMTLQNRAYIRKTRLLIEKERAFLSNEIAKIKGLIPYPSVTNFLLVKIEKGNITSKALQHALIKKGFLVRDCSNFRNLSKRYIRIAVRSRKENRKLLNALKKTL